jgi:class 3 adenylate cyclase/tetratricopeptide (TPR) repeat protein/energy-coupling factor transporter ATP-binding protein EcfA2
MNRIGSGGKGQRFYMTLLFSDLSGYTALTEASDPEDIDLLKHEIATRAKRVIGKCGGSINQFYGDGILAVFGYPVPDEDDARRGIEAAIAFHESIRALRVDIPLPGGFQLRMHSGVHSGVVLARAGDPLHGQYELTGDAVNTTQRLCAAARPDDIVVSGSTLFGLEPYFETEEIAPLTLKGKGRAMLAYRVQGRSNVSARFDAQNRRGLTPFVGREAALERLQREMANAVQGTGGVVCVTGPAGIGKSRLLDTFRRRLPPTTAVFSGSCEHFGNVAPLRPFSQAVQQAYLAGEELAPEQSIERLCVWLEAIDDSLTLHLSAFLHLLSLGPSTDRGADGSGISQKVDPNDIGRALAAVFAKVASRQPVTIILDDWHWADDASKQALRAIVRAVQEAPVLTVIGLRAIPADDLLLWDAATLALDPFTIDESTRAVRALLPKALDVGVSEAMHRRSGGNPLFLEELCRSVPAQIASDPASVAIPTTIHGLIQARVAQLPADEMGMLRASAVIGNDIPWWLLEKVTAPGDTRLVLSRLMDHELLFQGDTEGAFHFQHGITREVVYESVPMQERKTLHGMVARALEDRFSKALAEQYEPLAYHYARSAEHARAIDYAELAGDKALANSALDRVRLQYQAALAAIDAQPPAEVDRKRWLRISSKWAHGCVYSPGRSQLEVLERAAKYARDLVAHETLALTQYWLGWISYALGDQERAIQHYVEALELATATGHSHLRVQLIVNLGQSYAAAGEYPRAMEYLTEGIDLNRSRAGRTGKRGVPVGFAYALGCRALVHGDRGDFLLAYADVTEAMSLVKGSSHAVEGSLCILLGMIQIWQGEWEACLETGKRARVTAEQVHGPYVLAMSHAMSGYARWVLETSPDALKQLRQSVEWLEARDIRLFLSFNYALLADALVTAGEPAAARDFALRALRRAEEKDPIGQTTAHRALARAAVRMRDIDEKAQLDSARASGELRGSRRETAVTDLLIGERHLAADDRTAAGAALRTAKASFEAMGMHWYRRRAQALLDAL